jgi:hypothetical protein
LIDIHCSTSYAGLTALLWNLTFISSLHPIGHIGEVILFVIRWRTEFGMDLIQFPFRDTGNHDLAQAQSLFPKYLSDTLFDRKRSDNRIFSGVSEHGMIVSRDASGIL